MKKILTLILAVLFATSLIGCADNTPKVEAEGDVIKIGLIQYVDHTSLNIIRDSFIARLEELGYDKSKVIIDYQNAQGEASNIQSICQKFVADKVDYIAAIATPAAQGAAAATENTDIPVIFIAVSDPLKAGLVESLENPTKNITGTSDVIPVDQIFDLVGKLTPDVKTLGFIYNLSEANSQTFISNAKQFCEEKGIAYIEATASNPSEVPQAAQSLVGKVDAIMCPNDNTVASAMPSLAQVANEAKIPVYAGAVTMVKDGGFASVGVDSAEIGVLSAELAKELLEGKKASETPVTVVKKYNAKVNKETAEILGIDVTGYETVE